MDFQGISMDSFWVFLTVSDLGSIAKASEDLLLDASSVSRRIQALEQEVGTALFVRSSQGVRLTRAGRILYDFAKELHSKISELKGGIKLSNPALSEISIGSYDSIASTKQVDFFAKALKKFKRVQISNDTQALVRAFNDGVLDALIVDQELSTEFEEDYRERELFSEAFCLVYSLKNAQVAAIQTETVSKEDLANLELLLYPDNCPIYKKIRTAYPNPRRLPVIHQIEFASSAVSIVTQSDWVTVLPESLARAQLEKSGSSLGIKRLSAEFNRHISLFSRNEKLEQLILELGLID
ncbi:MAG: LysR family transcriptional regulator [Streptococcaceae bacterium]|jgi:DNA-binding transcriptional LysR family regulator|nr:LysR family transcriptional regulator [Streptococcaceae bacterium]